MMRATLTLLVALVAVSTASCSSAASPAPIKPIDLTNVDPCGLLDADALQSASLHQTRAASRSSFGNGMMCKYSMPSGVDTLISLSPSLTVADFERGLNTPDRTTDRSDITVAGLAATQFKTSTTRGGHTACAIVTDFGQHQLAAVIDNDLGGRDTSIDSMCQHASPVAEAVFSKLTR